MHDASQNYHNHVSFFPTCEQAPAVDQQSVPQPEQQQQGHQKVDPVLERNYRENFHTVVSQTDSGSTLLSLTQSLCVYMSLTGLWHSGWHCGQDDNDVTLATSTVHLRTRATRRIVPAHSTAHAGIPFTAIFMH